MNEIIRRRLELVKERRAKGLIKKREEPKKRAPRKKKRYKRGLFVSSYLIPWFDLSKISAVEYLRNPDVKKKRDYIRTKRYYWLHRKEVLAERKAYRERMRKPKELKWRLPDGMAKLVRWHKKQHFSLNKVDDLELYNYKIASKRRDKVYGREYYRKNKARINARQDLYRYKKRVEELKELKKKILERKDKLIGLTFDEKVRFHKLEKLINNYKEKYGDKSLQK